MDLNGKVAIVTGAGSGIGYAIAERFAGAGAGVCVNYLGYADDAKALAARLPRAIAVEGDVSKAADVRAMVDRTVQELGGVDVLVNNAGLERQAAFLDIDEASWDLVLGVNLKGAFLCMQACGRVMRDSGKGGSIVNISSVHEDLSFPGFAPYCASKGGLRMLMRNTAVELAPFRIRVNNVAPGAIATPINKETLDDPEKLAVLHRIIPLGRMGEAAEVAEVALFLASDASCYVTGSTYCVDGGLTRYAQSV
jgi:glucose 1-dehydrogenase